MVEREVLDKKIIALYGPNTARVLNKLKTALPPESASGVYGAILGRTKQLLEQYEPLRLIVWAEGGYTSGQKMDERIKAWGEDLATTQIALVEIAKKAPSLFIVKK